jgi:hypothetical protein
VRVVVIIGNRMRAAMNQRSSGATKTFAARNRHEALTTECAARRRRKTATLRCLTS